MGKPVGQLPAKTTGRHVDASRLNVPPVSCSSMSGEASARVS